MNKIKIAIWTQNPAKVSAIEEAIEKWWAFWHWSDDILTRKDQFVLAFLSWIVPFFNKYYKLK